MMILQNTVFYYMFVLMIQNLYSNRILIFCCGRIRVCKMWIYDRVRKRFYI